jgi:hypothetical protein
MKLVVLESPYSGDIEVNLHYARRCLAHSISLGEAPLASHLLYTQPGVLDDTIPEERNKGMLAGHAWLATADYLVVYTDLGISSGMLLGMKAAEIYSVPIIYRKILE